MVWLGLLMGGIHWMRGEYEVVYLLCFCLRGCCCLFGYISFVVSFFKLSRFEAGYHGRGGGRMVADLKALSLRTIVNLCWLQRPQGSLSPTSILRQRLGVFYKPQEPLLANVWSVKAEICKRSPKFKFSKHGGMTRSIVDYAVVFAQHNASSTRRVDGVAHPSRIRDLASGSVVVVEMCSLGSNRPSDRVCVHVGGITV